MNESFDFKRFYALFAEVNFMLRIIGEVITVLFMTALFLSQKTGSILLISIFIFGPLHRISFEFLSSQSGLSRFLLLPASHLEKFIALVINAILRPAILIFIISKCVLFVTMNFRFFSNVQPIKLDELYFFILLFVILFFLRLVFRWKNFGLDLFLPFLFMIPLLLLNKYIHDGYYTLPNYPIYHGLFFILLASALLSFAYTQMKKLEIYNVKEKAGKLSRPLPNPLRRRGS